MKRIPGLALVLVTLGWIVCAAAASNLNLSKSNINRLVYPPSVSQAQAAAILATLDQAGPGMNEATVTKALQKAGIRDIRKIVILPPSRTGSLSTIILLTNPADEPAAREIAVSDSGVVSTPKPPIIIKK